VAAASAAYAQEPLPAAAPAALDSSTRNVVTAFSVRSGKIALSSAANPGPASLPDGTYTNENNTIIVILDGRIVRIQTSSGAITEISSARVTRLHGIMLTPSTNALMAVSEITLPSGTFKSEDGASSVTVVAGRPTAFTLSSALPNKR
jgi:hypothetical protein